MTHWKSDRVVAGTPEYAKAKTVAQVHRLHVRQNLCLDHARVEWRDEYNDYSVAGVFAVVS